MIVRRSPRIYISQVRDDLSFSELRKGAGPMGRLGEVEDHTKAQNSDRSVVLAAQRPVITAFRSSARLSEYTLHHNYVRV